MTVDPEHDKTCRMRCASDIPSRTVALSAEGGGKPWGRSCRCQRDITERSRILYVASHRSAIDQLDDPAVASSLACYSSSVLLARSWVGSVAPVSNTRQRDLFSYLG